MRKLNVKEVQKVSGGGPVEPLGGFPLPLTPFRPEPLPWWLRGVVGQK